MGSRIQGASPVAFVPSGFIARGPTFGNVSNFIHDVAPKDCLTQVRQRLSLQSFRTLISATGHIFDLRGARDDDLIRSGPI